MARILVIDDDTNIRRVLSRFLQQRGHTVVEAPDGKTALRSFMEEPADLVLSDIYMPEMDGIELLLRLRETFPDARLAAMSGGGAIAARHVLDAAKALGAIAILEKPFDLEAVLDLVAELEREEVAS